VFYSVLEFGMEFKDGSYIEGQTRTSCIDPAALSRPVFMVRFMNKNLPSLHSILRLRNYD